MSEPDPRLLQGLRLAQGRNWFDAHEALEELWQETPEGDWREALQTVIQQCVALEHLQRGNALGAFKVWNKARAKTKKLAPWVNGIGVGPWDEALAAFYKEADLATRVQGQLEGGVAAGEEHITDLPDLPPAETWPLPPLSDELAAQVRGS